ncbi:unnamed protein product, partial [Mesorhabditis spiculigera]
MALTENSRYLSDTLVELPQRKAMPEPQYRRLCCGKIGYEVLSIVWLILLVLGCVALAILPYPDVNHYFQYSGSQNGARIFASVMFFILVCLCISKFMMQPCERDWDCPKGSGEICIWKKCIEQPSSNYHDEL